MKVSRILVLSPLVAVFATGRPRATYAADTVEGRTVVVVPTTMSSRHGR